MGFGAASEKGDFHQVRLPGRPVRSKRCVLLDVQGGQIRVVPREKLVPLGDRAFFFMDMERECKKMNKRIFSGIQPTGVLHLGNYLGALKHFIEYQEEANTECFYCVVDLHALTVPRDPKELQEKTLDLIALYLAVGLDPQKATLFVQSHVPAHSEGAWLFTTISRMGELSRMTQYKDKSQGSGETAGVGLFTYPVLMAADILLYQATHVPVGEDQKQHLELTRDLAERFNRDYGDILTIPKPMIEKVGARIMGLDQPEKKMSKSAKSEMNYITLLDPPKLVEKKIKRAVTDSENEIRFDPENKPGVSNLLTIQSVITGKSLSELEQHYQGLGYGALKKELIEVINDHLQPIQKRYHQIRNSDQLLEILKVGAKKADEVANETLAQMQKAMGLIQL